MQGQAQCESPRWEPWREGEDVWSEAGGLEGTRGAGGAMWLLDQEGNASGRGLSAQERKHRGSSFNETVDGRRHVQKLGERDKLFWVSNSCENGKYFDKFKIIFYMQMYFREL